MGLKCLACNTTIGRYNDYLECTGECKMNAHIACVGITVDQLVEMKRSGEVKTWKCSVCRGVPNTNLEASAAGAHNSVVCEATNKLETGVRLRAGSLGSDSISPCGNCIALAEHFSNIVEKLEKKIMSEMRSFKTQLLNEFEAVLTAGISTLGNTTERSTGPFPSSVNTGAVGKSFAEVVSDACSFVVKPVKAAQSVSATKTALYQKINPADNKIGLARVRGIKDGGVVVNCVDTAESNRFKAMATEKLGDEYSVQEVASLLPRIKLVGLSERFEGEELLNCLKVQNQGIIFEQSVCKFINCKALRNRGDVYQATIQVDRLTYQRAFAAKRMFVGYDNCTVYDAIEVKRCYRCSGLNHMSRGCRRDSVCPKCAGSHSIGSCGSEELKCANCIRHNEKSGGSDDIGHAAWDSACPCYTRILSSIRSDILGVK